MKRIITVLFLATFIYGCQEKESPKFFNKYDETDELVKQQEHENPRMKLKLFQSKYLDMNKVFEPLTKLNLSPYSAVTSYKESEKSLHPIS